MARHASSHARPRCARSRLPSMAAIDADACWPRGQARPARQAQAALEQPVGHRAAAHRACREDRLQVHRLPDAAATRCSRPRGASRMSSRVAPNSARIDGDAGQPAVRAAVGGFGHELDAGQPRQRRAVALVDRRAVARACSGSDLQLAAADRREQVAQPVVVADLRVLVVRRRIARLRREVARALDDVAPVRHEHAAAAGRDDLVAVERERRALAERAGLLAAVGGAERLGGVLDQRHAVARADRVDAARSRRTGRRGRPRSRRPPACRAAPAARVELLARADPDRGSRSRGETSTNTGVAPT